MGYQRHAYDDASSTSRMTADCRAVEEAMALPVRPTLGETAAQAAGRSALSIRFEHYPRDVSKPSITVSAAAARLGAALHLHLD